jgi:hypothetical protein
MILLMEGGASSPWGLPVPDPGQSRPSQRHAEIKTC